VNRPGIRPWPPTLVLWVIALSALALAVPVVSAGRRTAATDSEPLAPGLAALSDAELLDLLLHRAAMPDGWWWSFTHETGLVEDFGYHRDQVADRNGAIVGYRPADCAKPIGMVSAGAFDAAEVAGYDPVHPGDSYDRKDIRLALAREFDPAGFADMVASVSRCTHVTFDTARYHSRYTIDILEDSGRGGDTRLFRYSVTTHTGDSDASTRYHAYARSAHLILRGTATDGHRGEFDALFADTLARINAAAT